jgi:hypothetical protein
MAALANEFVAAADDARKGYDTQFRANAERWGVDPASFIRGAGAAKDTPKADTGRGTADSPIKVTPKASPATREQRVNAIPVDF